MPDRSNLNLGTQPDIYDVPGELLHELPSRWHVPFVEHTASVGTHEPTQERDVPWESYIGPPEPRGPALSDTGLGDARSDRAELARALAAVMAEAERARRKITEFAAVTGQTNASGNLDLPIFYVPAGFECAVVRVNIEDATHTPASPFSAATAWLALIRGDHFGPGSILDFGPATVGTTIIPSIFSTSENHAPILRGGEILSLHVVGSATLANTPIFARAQMSMREL